MKINREITDGELLSSLLLGLNLLGLHHCVKKESTACSMLLAIFSPTQLRSIMSNLPFAQGKK